MHGLCVVFKVRRGAENLECRFRLRLRLFRFLIYVVGFAVWGQGCSVGSVGFARLLQLFGYYQESTTGSQGSSAVAFADAAPMGSCGLQV